ncbi:MAG: peptidoglycan DD-metalloendopeptidase family protein [bacterium]
MLRSLRVQIAVTALCLASITGASLYSLAAKDEVLEIKDTIDAKKDRINSIKKQADAYRNEIAKKEAEQASLSNQIAILENKSAATELDIQALNQEIESTITDIGLLEGQIEIKTSEMSRKKALVSELVRNIRESDGTSTLEILLNNDTFSEFFDRVERMRDIEERTFEAVHDLKGLRDDMLVRKQKADSKRVTLDNQRAELQGLKTTLDDEQIAKSQLMQQTAMSEQKFQALLADIRDEQMATEAQVRRLEGSLKDVLKKNDDTIGGGTLLSWPVSSRVITVVFHDPTYPFRRLFEHSGLDLATPQGTPVHAAAPGYVGTAKLGTTMYGNYIVLIHSGGISTLYAHISRMVVKPDTYVERGDVIGYSGGTPGTPGAGLSTGPHLHFEARSNGVPQNPLNFLVAN